MPKGAFREIENGKSDGAHVLNILNKLRYVSKIQLKTFVFIRSILNLLRIEDVIIWISEPH